MEDKQKYLSLLKEVFGQDKGRELLKMLIMKHQCAKLFVKDPIQQAYKIGKHDLIQELKLGLALEIDDIEEILTPSPYNPFRGSNQ